MVRVARRSPLSVASTWRLMDTAPSFSESSSISAPRCTDVSERMAAADLSSNPDSWLEK